MRERDPSSVGVKEEPASDLSRLFRYWCWLWGRDIMPSFSAIVGAQDVIFSASYGPSHGGIEHADVCYGHRLAGSEALQRG